MERWICSGEGAGTFEACAFSASSEAAAMDHFEATGHSVDSADDDPTCPTSRYSWIHANLIYEPSGRFTCGTCGAAGLRILAGCVEPHDYPTTI